jgi:hypothetical protein
MKNSHFDRLMERYVTAKTSKHETIKVEAMLKAIQHRKIHFISEETEELLYRKILDQKITADEVSITVKAFSCLKVPGINWLRIAPFEVFFCKDLIQ